MYLQDIYTIAINLAGLPAISIPNGFSSNKMPLGLQLIGPQKEDRKVFHAAHALEKMTSYHLEIPEFVKEQI
jgi:aspartyl-tRNA(Asn)/glutamyl-tRNA(Gln) amidotransferase subunit A